MSFQSNLLPVSTNTNFLIYDGAPAHSNAARPRDFIRLMILPSFSPFLNIIEQGISAFNAAIKYDISRPEVQVQRWGIDLERGTKVFLQGEYRQRLLRKASDRNVGTITVQKCTAWYQFMQTCIPRCLNCEVIQG